MDTFISCHSEGSHTKDQYYTTYRIVKLWNWTSFVHVYCAIKTLGVMFTSVLLLCHYETANMSCLICMTLNFVSHQTTWHNKRDFNKRYSVTRHFSWFKNYKLYSFSNLFLGLVSLVPKHFMLSLTQIKMKILMMKMVAKSNATTSNMKKAWSTCKIHKDPTF